MINKIKVKISPKAYKYILNLLNKHKEYSYLRLEKGTCCKNIISLLLDNKKEDDIEGKIQNLNFVYNKNLLNIVTEVIIVLKNGSIMIKATKINTSCNGCTKNRTSCYNNKNCNNCQKN